MGSRAIYQVQADPSLLNLNVANLSATYGAIYDSRHSFHLQPTVNVYRA